MKRRFEGEEGKNRLIEALCKQQIVNNDKAVAEKIASLVELIQVEVTDQNKEIIKQHGTDNEIYLIVCGKVSITINGREVATRNSGCHIGEMALIDPISKRCASVTVTEQTVLARITEPKFTQLANEHPQLWRMLALELACRLRERGNLVTPPNQKSNLFIGSSTEHLDTARELHASFSHDDFMLATLWTQGVFQASQTSIESLIRQTKMSDFAVLLLTKDDTTTSRHRNKPSPRDNMIFELGLFMGYLGRERTILVKERGADLKIPSDLLGITLIDFASGDQTNLAQRIAPVYNEIRKLVRRMGPK